MQKKIEKICNQEIEVMTANETRHQTHYIVYPLGMGVACFFERGACIFKKALMIIL
jgi:hypothetical protein